MHKHVEYRHQPSHNLCQKRRNSKQKQTYEANNIAHGTQLMVEKKMDKELEEMGGIKHHQRCCGQGGQGVGGDGWHQAPPEMLWTRVGGARGQWRRLIKGRLTQHFQLQLQATASTDEEHLRFSLGHLIKPDQVLSYFVKVHVKQKNFHDKSCKAWYGEKHEISWIRCDVMDMRVGGGA